MLKVPREDFMPRYYKDYAYLEVPFPLLASMHRYRAPRLSLCCTKEALWLLTAVGISRRVWREQVAAG